MSGAWASILGTPVTAGTFEQALLWLESAVAERRPTFMSAATVYSVMLAREDPTLAARVVQAGWVMADGMPLVWALRLLGQHAERVHGDDLFLEFCRRFPHRRSFLLGGGLGQPEKVVRELIRRFPRVEVVGTRSTPVRPLSPTDCTAALADISASGAELVWVGMGTPAQDVFMADHAERAGIPLAGVGSAFDLLAGRTRPAPTWMKRSGLQWLFRLVQEPRRLGSRYLVYNPLFLWHFALQLARRREAPLGAK